MKRLRQWEKPWRKKTLVIRRVGKKKCEYYAYSRCKFRNYSMISLAYQIIYLSIQEKNEPKL